MGYYYQFDIAALIIAVVLLFNFCIRRTIINSISRIFVFFVSIIIVACITDLVTMWTLSNCRIVPVWLNYLLNIIYLLSYNALSPLFFYGLMLFTSKDRRMSFTVKLLIFLPYLYDVVVLLSTPATHWAMYFTDEGTYGYSSGFIGIILIGFLYLVMVIFRTFVKFNQFTWQQRVILIIYPLANLCAVIIQNIWNDVLIPLFIASFTSFLIYLSLDNPTDYIDGQFGVYNLKGFESFIKDKLYNNRKIYVVAVQIEGVTYLNETLGFENVNEIFRQLLDYLISFYGKKNCFRLSGYKFGVYVESEDEKKFIISAIHERFSRSFVVHQVELSLSYKIAYIRCVDESDNYETIKELLFYSLDSADIPNGAVVETNKLQMEKVRREKKVLEILKKAIADEEFEIVYQPVYSVLQKKYVSAEALVRLMNSEIGYIGPEEFIPIAEKNGLIIELGEIIFRSVCHTILEKKIWTYGIERVSVNLSVLQCMQEKLHIQLQEIMDSYCLENKYIQLEIPDSAVSMCGEFLLSNMKLLQKKNTRFVLDNFGMGSSSRATISDYPFDSIKIDKSVVQSVDGDYKSLRVLLHTVELFRDLQIKAVAVGIETKEQAERFTEMGFDSLQGFYFSKPLFKDELIDFLQMNNKV